MVDYGTVDDDTGNAVDGKSYTESDIYYNIYILYKEVYISYQYWTCYVRKLIYIKTELEMR